jgi:STE24 endopeptidase
MSRLLLLAILVLWMFPRDNIDQPAWSLAGRVGLFLGVYAALVLMMAAWSRRLARRVADDFLGRTLDRYNTATELARYFIPIWFAVGLFLLGWGHLIHDFLLPIVPGEIARNQAIADFRAGLHGMPKSSEIYWRIPGLLLGTLPAFAAWIGLWWAQYPADRALKEQSVIYEANEGLPIHAPPGFATFFVEHFRQQLLFTLAPVLMIVSARDLLALGFLIFGRHPLPREGSDLMIIPLSAAIFIFLPELLKRIIPTKPLPLNWPLRRRLETLCQRAGLKYRDILLWQTNNSMGNAMVMGLFPRVRYIFLSDLLLETMKDEEIEAVFAHEIGHIVHRHMWWYVLFMVLVMLFVMGPLAYLLNLIPGLSINGVMTAARQATINNRVEQTSEVLAFATFILMFGFLSRRFERQADVYAARTMEACQDRGTVTISHVNPEAPSTGGLFVPALAVATVGASVSRSTTVAYASPSHAHVGEYGAEVVAGALHRVAQINNIPVSAREWLHGSIAHRMRYLRTISGDASRTREFDRSMRRLKWGLLTLLMMLGTWVWVQYGMGQ